MTRLISILLVLSFLLAGCSLPTPVTPASPTAGVPAVTATGALPPTLAPDPTLSPTGLPGGTPISAANLAQVVTVMDTIVPAYTSRLLWMLDGQSLAAFGAGQINRLRLDPLALDFRIVASGTDTLLDLSPHGQLVLVATPSGGLALKSPTGDLVREIPLNAPASSASFSPDGTRLVVASTAEWRVDLIDPQTGQVVQSLTGFETAAPVYSAVIGADNATLLWRARATVQAQNIASGELGPRLAHEDFIGDMALSRSGSLLAATTSKTAAGGTAPVIQLWEPFSGADLGVLTLSDIARAIAFSPDGSLLAAAVGNEIQIWDPIGKTQLGTLSGHTGLLTALAFSPDGSALVSASEDGQIRLWKAP